MADTQSWSTGRRIAVATLIAGTLDIGMAAIDTASKGKPIDGMLRGIGGAAYKPAAEWGLHGAALGLAVHFAIMAVIASVFILIRDRVPLVRAHTLVAAALYGVALWLVMYGGVLHLGFGVPFPSADPIAIAKQLFAHVILVGLTIGLVAKR